MTVMTLLLSEAGLEREGGGEDGHCAGLGADVGGGLDCAVMCLFYCLAFEDAGDEGSCE